MRMVSFVRLRPRHVVLFKVLVILLIVSLIVPRAFFLVRDIISPGIEPGVPLEEDHPGVEKVWGNRGSEPGFWGRFWFNLKNFYRYGILIF